MTDQPRVLASDPARASESGERRRRNRRIRVPLLGRFAVSWTTFRAAALAAPILFIVVVWLYFSRVHWPSGLAQRGAFVTAVSVGASLAFAIILLTAVDRAYERLEASVRTARRQNLQLKALHQAGLALTQDLDLTTVLGRVVELSREVVGARYAALRVLDSAGGPGEFLTSGMSAEEIQRVGEPPAGRGILGIVARSQHPIRLRRLQDHPDSVGFPPHHPPMETFLGAPVRFRDETFGFLYLTEKVGAREFSQADEETAERFAAQAGAAIANARLLREVHRLASVAERERIGRELHDGTLQGLYAISLHLQAVLLDATESAEPYRAAIKDSLERINRIMGEIRRDVFRSVDGLGECVNLEEVLRGAVAGVLPGLGPSLTFQWQAPREFTLPERVAHDLGRVVREAVANAVRHAHARAIRVMGALGEERLCLEVADDGTGFDADAPRGPSGHGLANMRSRVQALGGKLGIHSAPGQGTRLTITLPLADLEKPGPHGD